MCKFPFGMSQIREVGSEPVAKGLPFMNQTFVDGGADSGLQINVTLPNRVPYWFGCSGNFLNDGANAVGNNKDGSHNIPFQFNYKLTRYLNKINK